MFAPRTWSNSVAVGLVHAYTSNMFCKVFTGLKGLFLVIEALSSAGAIMCVVHALRAGQKDVITDPQKRIRHKFTASSTL